MIKPAVIIIGGLAALGGIALAVSEAQAHLPEDNDDAGPVPPDSTEGPVFHVTASDGHSYVVKFVKAFEVEAGHQVFWDVFDTEGNRLVRYTQVGEDDNTRTFIVSPLGVGDTHLDEAMKDFGVHFEGGPIATPAVATGDELRVLPGQLLVTPGEYLATIDVGFPKSMVVSASLIKGGLKDQGFRQVAVFTSAPKDWPISKDGNYFVQAVWDKSPKIFNVPGEVVDIRSRGLV